MSVKFPPPVTDGKRKFLLNSFWAGFCESSIVIKGGLYSFASQVLHVSFWNNEIGSCQWWTAYTPENSSKHFIVTIHDRGGGEKSQII